jgi:Condensation domain
VRFAGEGSGVGELSWGQREMWFKIRRRGCPLAIGGVFPLPAGAAVDDTARMLRFLMSRHPSLRTRLLIDTDGWTRQSVAACGEIALEIIDAGDGDPAALAEVVFHRYHDTDFAYPREWPVRMALIRSGGALSHLVVMYSHVAVDGGALSALLADLATMDPVTGRSPAPLRGQHPLEQARRQGTLEGQRQSQTALRRWERLLRTIPASRFGGCGADQEPRYRSALLQSPAMYLAIPAIADRHGGDTSAVLLTAFAIAQARVTGISLSVMQLVVGNRFRPGLSDTVSTVAQSSVSVIDTTGLTFDQAVARARKAAFIAYKDAYYDPVQRDELIARLSKERGEDIDVACYFNDRRNLNREMASGPVPTSADLRAALKLGSLQWRDKPMDPVSERFEVFIEDTPGTIEVLLCTDTRYMSAGHTEAFAREMETAIVQAVLGPGRPGQA